MNSIQIITKESFWGIVWFVVWIVFCRVVDFSLGFLLGVVLLAAWLWAFRNPERTPSDRGDDIVLAPIDGTISNIEHRQGTTRLSIDVSFFDVGLVRAPQEVETITLEKKFGLVAYFSPLQKELNEVLRADIVGKISCSIWLYPKVFKHARFYAPIAYRLGERMGFMKLGTLVLELPDSVEIRAHIGDRIKGGSSVLGYTK